MEDDQPHPLENPLVHPLDDCIVHLIMAAVSPPEKNVRPA